MTHLTTIEAAGRPVVLKRHHWTGAATTTAIVRYPSGEFAVRDAGVCQSLHRTYTQALAAFNVQVRGA